MRMRRLWFYILSCGTALFTAAVWYDHLSMVPDRSLITLPVTNLSFDTQAYRSHSGASEGMLIHPKLSTMSQITTLSTTNKQFSSLDFKQRYSNIYPYDRELIHDITKAQSTINYIQKSSTNYFTVDDENDPFNLKISKQSTTPKYSNQGKRRQSDAFNLSKHRKSNLNSPSKDIHYKSSTTRDGTVAFKSEKTRRKRKQTDQNDALDISNHRKVNLDSPSEDVTHKSYMTRDTMAVLELEQAQKKKTDQTDAFDTSDHRKANLDSPSNDANYKSSIIRDPWKAEQARRKARLRKVCAGWKKSHRDVLSASKDELFHLLVDDKHQAIYCYVPKVGCTNWKRLWMMLTGLSNETDPLNIPEMLPHDSHHTMMLINQNNTTIRDMETKLKKYKKFMVVRDPYERLLSAFKDKLEQPGNEYYQSNVGDHIRKTRFWEFKHGEYNITFPQFVSFVNSLKRGGFDEHWKPYSLTCFPCAINYNVIGKFETLVEDSERFLRMIGAPKDLHFPPYRPGNTSTLLSKYLAQLSPRQLNKLNTLYKDDLEAFDYKPWSPKDVGLT